MADSEMFGSPNLGLSTGVRWARTRAQNIGNGRIPPINSIPGPAVIVNPD